MGIGINFFERFHSSGFLDQKKLAGLPEKGWLAKSVTGRGERVLPATDEKMNDPVVELLKS